MKKSADQALTHILRDLPPRSAPGTLEARVLQQLDRRRSLVWWHRGFTHWPAAARTGFVITCMALIVATLLDTRWSTLGSGALRRAFRWALSWTYPAAGDIASGAGLLTQIVHSLPGNWLYAIVAIAAVLYAALVGLGLAAYRTLYLSSPPRRVIQ